MPECHIGERVVDTSARMCNIEERVVDTAARMSHRGKSNGAGDRMLHGGKSIRHKCRDMT